MKIINLQQNTPEWHTYRNIRIGASDFALFACHKGLSNKIFNASLSENIYNKINNLQIQDNIYIQRGREYEPILNEYFNNHTDGLFIPIIVEYSDNIYSSLDGYDAFSNEVVEYKTTSKSIDDELDILQYYVWQLKHQMKCADKKNCYLLIKYFNDDMIIIYNVKIEDDKINIYNNDLILSIDDITDEKWLSLCNEYLDILNNNKIDKVIFDEYDEINNKIEELEQRKKIIKELIIKNYPEGGVCHNYTVSKVKTERYSYKDFIDDNNLVIDDKYKNISLSYRINKKDIKK